MVRVVFFIMMDYSDSYDFEVIYGFYGSLFDKIVIEKIDTHQYIQLFCDQLSQKQTCRHNVLREEKIRLKFIERFVAKLHEGFDCKANIIVYRPKVFSIFVKENPKIGTYYAVTQVMSHIVTNDSETLLF